jgi:hypothetical protein
MMVHDCPYLLASLVLAFVLPVVGCAAPLIVPGGGGVHSATGKGKARRWSTNMGPASPRKESPKKDAPKQLLKDGLKLDIAQLA